MELVPQLKELVHEARGQDADEDDDEEGGGAEGGASVSL